MKKSLKLIITVFLIMLFSISLSANQAYKASATTNKNSVDPWNQKEILNYLLCTSDTKLSNDVIKLKNDLQLTDAQILVLRNISIQEHQSILSEELNNKNNLTFNSLTQNHFTNIDNETKKILGNKYGKFRTWIKKWWKDEIQYRANWYTKQMSNINSKNLNNNLTISSQATSSRILVYATQYNAYTTNEVALPDKYIKYANNGFSIPYPYYQYYNNPTYTINIGLSDTSTLKLTGVKVLEVGPWNEDDNYWDSSSYEYTDNPRRYFGDCGLGYPEAAAAYYSNYNDGRDEFARTVTNPAGIDLSPNIAKNIGLSSGQNAWVYVDYYRLP